MRIVGGDLKGKKIFLPLNKDTRPLRDIVKESIFNLIEHSKKINFKIKNSKVLDLFSGTGSFGFECISRGAEKVQFVEKNSNALKILKKNISHLKIINKSKITEKDCMKFLKAKENFNEKFHFIFIDPPYRDKEIDSITEIIKLNKILEKDGTIIIHRHKSDDVKLSDKIKIIDMRTYGISKIIFSN